MSFKSPLSVWGSKIWRSLFRLEIAILLLGIGGVAWSHAQLKGKKSPSGQVYFVTPSKYLEHFTFGYHELVADLLWIRALQDFEKCDRPVAQGALCNQSWAYQMVEKVTDLSPRFRIIYATIPLLLSVVINDQEGAIRLLEKGVKYFPDDWPILYRGGYLYLYDQNNKEKAAEFFVRSQKNGGPDWLASFATRLYSESGQDELARQVIRDFEGSGLSEGLLKRMRDHLLKKSPKVSF